MDSISKSLRQLFGSDPTRVGLALSGGSIRGVAHLGVLHAFEEANIDIHALSGASAGSLVATLYASGLSPHRILNIVKETSLFELFRPKWPATGLTDLSKLREILQPYLGDKQFSDLKIPVYVSVTDLTKGRNLILNEGKVLDIVLASSSIPLLFKPQHQGEDLWVDGGLTNNLPIEPLKDQVDLVIGVNVNPIEPDKELDGFLDIATRTIQMALWANIQPRLRYCDLVIEPQVRRFGWFDLEDETIDQLFKLGYKAARERLDELKEIMNE